MKKALHEKLSMLARARGLSQTKLSEHMEVHVNHVNRYFRGHSDMHSTHLVHLLKALGIDIEQMVSDKIKKHTEVTDTEVDSIEGCLQYLFKSLDPLGQQTFLNNLAWATRVSSKKKLPPKVEEILKKEISLI